MADGSSNRGRKNAYDSKIAPRFDEIKKWVNEGCTEKSIAKALGIGYSTLAYYKVEKPEFAKILKKDLSQCVDMLESKMFDSAIGQTVTVKKATKLKRKYQNLDEGIVEETEEIVYFEEEIYIPPNVSANIYLLKHWAKEKGYTNDPQMLDLKKRELDHKIKMDEQNSW